MTIKSKILILAATIGILGVIGGIYAYRYFSANKISRENEGNKTTAQELQDCLPKSDMASKEKCDQMIATIKTFEQCTDAGFSIIRNYPEQCQTPDGRIFVNDNPPDEGDLSKAKDAVRAFMGNPNLELQYVISRRHPTNFQIGKATEFSDGGGFTMDTPPEWDRPVYIFQQKEYINDQCQAYQYQVTVKTNQVVEISLVYSEEKPMTSDERIVKCASYGSLEIPLKTKSEVEQAAFAYLARDTEHTKFTMRSDIQSEYIPSKKGVANPAHNEWRWEDKSISLPDGLTGDPWQHPIARIIMTSGGKLIYYLNTTDLFGPNL